MNVESKEHLLALKVMCLTHPNLLSPRVISAEATDLPGKTFDYVMRNDITAVPELLTVGSGQFMLAPQAFRSIYLGETFSSYVCVYNCTNFNVSKVRVKADLQTTTKIHLPIHLNRDPVNLGPNETLDDTIHHEVKEIGNHVLICEVFYETPTGESESFRKFFKFQVLKPLDVQTKFYNSECGEIFLEAQIENKTIGTICLESVDLQNTDKYTVTPLNTLPDGSSVFSAQNMLQPNNSCQFLYCIKPVDGFETTAKSDPGIGKLDIVWRSNLGERGHLQTSQLQRSAMDYGDLRVSVVKAKSSVRLGEPFEFVIRVTNTSERSMDLNLNLNTVPRLKMAYTGATEFNVGNIEPGRWKDVKLTVTPIRLGLVTISKLQLTDSKKMYEFEDFVQVFVVEKDYKEEDCEMDQFVRYSSLIQRKTSAEL